MVGGRRAAAGAGSGRPGGDGTGGDGTGGDEAGGEAQFFTCDFLDVIPKDDMASMEHPLFSLATRPDRRVLSYSHGPVAVEVTPSVKGLATIHDKDILIYCVSQLVAALNRGEPVAPELRLRAGDLLAATGREASGDGYRRLREAFERLAGTRIVTNLATGGVETTAGFGLIDSWAILRRTRGGRMISVRVRLSDWIYRAVLARSVLTLHRDYFRLRKPLERRVYELARKHCGRQAEWRIGLETLQRKAGSASPRRVFRRMVRDLCAEDHLPDYSLAFGADDVLTVRRRRPGPAGGGGTGSGAGGGTGAGQGGSLPPVDAATLAAAQALAPGLDAARLEAEWRAFWAGTGRPVLRHPDRAFLAFCRARAARARMPG
jgi:hypothetical protein